MKIETMFADKELYEIEKIFDIQAGSLTRAMANIVGQLSTIQAFRDSDFVKRLYDETVNTFDIYRTISAKAAMARAGRWILCR